MASERIDIPLFTGTSDATAGGLATAARADGQRHERSDAAENRRRILAIAERLFAEHGVDAVCMQEIARAAGVGQGTLYRRFADKGALCMALLDAQMAEFQNDVLAALREMSQSGESRPAQLAWFFDVLIRFSQRHSPLLAAARPQLRSAGQENLTSRSAPFAWMHTTVAGLLTAGVRAREFRPDLDVAIVADLLLATVHPQVIHSLHLLDDDASLTRLSTAMKQLLDGLTMD
jgi:AcrR family transcriptional regulator